MHAQHNDVVVVGCGIAGLAAAVAAQEQDAKVVVLERAPVEERGGNTRYTPARLRMKSATELSDDIFDLFAANAGGHLDPELVQLTAESSEHWPGILRSMSFADPEVVSTFADEVPKTLAWLNGYGIKLEPVPIPFQTVQPRFSPSGGGLAMIDALAGAFERKGGHIVYETAAHNLIQDEAGEVVGVHAIGPGHRRAEFRGHAVILACGGFQGNAEMMTRYIGPKALNLRVVARGSHYNRGEGIRMALDIGAAPCGDYGNWHASPMDPRSARPEPQIEIYAYGILVNQRGQRFLDEAPGPIDGNRERISREIFLEPDGIAYAILDAKIADIPYRQLLLRTEQPPITAPTLVQLAAQLKIPAHALEATIAAFNQGCGEGTFTALKLDALSTRGVAPPKSNWARPIVQPPFTAYPIISSIVFTFGGLKVNSRAQVVNQQGEVIPGLYAAGETMGLYYKAYVGATSVLKGMAFGRISGIDAAVRAAAKR